MVAQSSARAAGLAGKPPGGTIVFIAASPTNIPVSCRMKILIWS
jgi:hypothetical protein